MWKEEFKFKSIIEGDDVMPEKEAELLPEEILNFVIEEKSISKNLRWTLLPNDLLKEIKQNPDYKNSSAYLNFLGELKEEIEMDKKLSVIIDSEITPKIVENMELMLKEKYGVEDIKLPRYYKTVFLDPLNFFVVHAEDEKSESFYVPSLKHSYLLNEGSDDFEYELKERLVHELFHALSKQRHWQIDFMARKEGSLEPIYLGKRFTNKRLGILTARMRKTTDYDFGIENIQAFRELNEAVTQKLTVEYFLISSEKRGISDVYFERVQKCYSEEQKALDLINQKVPFEMFVKAFFDKNAYRDLIKKIDESYGFKAATIISELMKWENKNYNSSKMAKKDPRKKYFLTKRFLNDKPVKLPAEIFKRIKPETAAKHPLIKISDF